MFPEEFQAWINGVTCIEIYEKHKGDWDELNQWKWGDRKALGFIQKETIDAVLEYYGTFSIQYLADEVQLGEPYKIAREGLKQFERGASVISKKSIREYYMTLWDQ